MNAARSSASPAQSANSGPITSGGMRRKAATNTLRDSSRSHSVQPVSGASRLAQARPERGEHQPLTVGPATVDRRLRRPRVARDLLQRQPAVAGPVEHGEGRVQHGGVDLPVARTAHARLRSRIDGRLLHSVSVVQTVMVRIGT